MGGAPLIPETLFVPDAATCSSGLCQVHGSHLAVPDRAFPHRALKNASPLALVLPLHLLPLALAAPLN